MYDLPLFAFFLLPLAAFIIAAVIEVRAKRNAAVKLRCVGVISVGFLSYLLFWIPALSPHHPSLHAPSWLIVVTAAVACSSFVVPYSSFEAKMLVLLGGLLLATDQLVLSH